MTELNMLKIFKKICEDNHLYYALCAGTLLGAVRHKGFIPWDDDIDVLMPRPDFDRLLHPEHLDLSALPQHIKLCSWKSSDYIPCPYVKLVDLRTTVTDQYNKIDKHIWIDVFPMDGCPKDIKKTETRFRRIELWKNILLIKNARIGQGKSFIKKVTKPFLYAFLLPLQKKNICNIINRMSKKTNYDSAEYVACFAWGYGPQERIDRKWFERADDMQFEDAVFHTPSNYHNYLSQLYGNYMVVPSEENRKTRHSFTAYANQDTGF